MKIVKKFADQKYTNAFVVIILFIFFSFMTEAFFNLENISDVIKSYSVLGILSCGMLPIIISGGIDVSVGAVVSASACVMAMFMKQISSSIVLAFWCRLFLALC